MSQEKLANNSSSSKKARKLSSARVEMHGVSKSYGEDWDAEDVIKAVSYTHLTLPTTPYV